MLTLGRGIRLKDISSTQCSSTVLSAITAGYTPATRLCSLSGSCHGKPWNSPRTPTDCPMMKTAAKHAPPHVQAHPRRQSPISPAAPKECSKEYRTLSQSSSGWRRSPRGRMINVYLPCTSAPRRGIWWQVSVSVCIDCLTLVVICLRIETSFAPAQTDTSGTTYLPYSLIYLWCHGFLSTCMSCKSGSHNSLVLLPDYLPCTVPTRPHIPFLEVIQNWSRYGRAT